MKLNNKTTAFIFLFLLISSIPIGLAISYNITDWDELNSTRDDLAGDYTLLNDLNSSTTGYTNYNTSPGFLPISTFTGSFDGQNYTIDGLYINRPSTNYVGLFGRTDGSTISNIGLTNLDITGASYVGGLIGAGTYGDSSTIDNSYSTGDVRGFHRVGGLIGDSPSITLNNSYSKVNVNASGNMVGGLVGMTYYSSIDNSYSTGNVSGSSYTGGLVGANSYSSIDNSYSTGNVSGSSPIGGLIGTNINTASIQNSFWYNRSQGLENCGSESGGATGCSNGEIIGKIDITWFYNIANAPMDVWDFVSTWLKRISNFPVLLGQEKENPQIQFVSPSTETGNYSQNYIEANITATDDISIDTINLTLWNSTGLIQSNTSQTSPLFVNFTSLPYGTYYLNASVNDTAGNTNQVETRTITYLLYINISSPTPSQIFTEDSPTANLNITTGVDMDICYYSNTTANYSMTKTNSTYFHTNAGSNLLDGSHTLTFWCSEKPSYSDSFDTTGSGNGNPQYLTQNGTYFWITDPTDDEVYKYWINGTYTGDSFDTTGSGSSTPLGITNNGTYFWIVDNNDQEVYKYWINGTYTGDSFDTSTQSGDPRGITSDGTYFWITDVNDDEVYKYWINGTYTGDSFDTTGSGNEAPNGITNDGTYFWITDPTDDEVYKYSMEIWHQSESISFDVDSVNITTCRDLTVSGREYELLNNLQRTSNSVCIQFENNNQVLEGNNYTIFNEESYPSYTFSNLDPSGSPEYNNTIIQNLNISNGRALFVGDNNSLININIFGFSTGLKVSASNSNITSLTINATDDDILISGGNATFYDIVLSGGDSSSDGQIWFYSSSDAHPIFLNSSFQTTNITSGSNLSLGWYVEPTINITEGFLENANISIYDKDNNLVYTGLTDANGEIPRQEIIEYEENSTGKTFKTPHTMNVTKTGYTTNSTTYNLSVLNNIAPTIILSPSLEISLSLPLGIYTSNESIPLNFSYENGSTIDKCWFKVINSTSDIIIDNQTITNCLNTTFDVPRVDDYNITIWINETSSESATDSGTFTVDTIPTVSIDTITTTIASQDVNFTSTITDDNLDTCQYTVYTLAGSPDGANENVSFNCANATFTVSGFATFNLSVTANDTSGNSATDSELFTTTQEAPPGGGGGSTTIITSGEIGWIMEVRPGIASYEDKRMPQNSQIRLSVDFENMGDSAKTIKLTCQDSEGDACKYITFEDEEFSLPLILDTKTRKYFTVSSNDAEGDFIFNIIGTDENGRIHLITTNLQIGNLGILEPFFKIFQGGKTKQGIPYYIIFFIPFIILWVLISAPLRRKKVPGALGIGFLSSLLISLSILFFF